MIEALQVSKTFNSTLVIRNFSVQIDKGDFVSIVGTSGTGKTTLLNILGLIEKPTSGQVRINGVACENRKKKMLLQRETLGYIFQNYALIENDTVENNLKLAIEYRQGINIKEEIKKGLQSVNLEGFETKKIFELSGGEQQRVAIARVAMKKCDYIFADEPTGNLDRVNRDLIFELLKKLNSEGRSVIYVTHDEELARCANWQISLC